MRKFIAVVLALVAVVCFCASCNNSDAEKVSVTVKITFDNEGTNMFDTQEVTMEYMSNEPATVLDAAIKVLDELEVSYKTGELGGHEIFTDIDGVKETEDKFWQLLVDDEVPDARLDTCGLYDGAKITLYFGKDLEDTAVTTELVTEAKTYETAADDYDG